MIKKEYLPGWALMVALAIASNFISDLIVIGGKNPVEASALAVVIGLLIRNAGLVPELCHAGIKTSETLLIWGIVLMGASMNFSDLAGHGLNVLVIIIITMASGFGLIYFFGKMFDLPSRLALLLAVGTTICGGTAIAITAPIIQARDEETSYAVATIALWGIVAILVYPQIGLWLGVDDIKFGVFAGTAIHSTPQVVGAGFIFSAMAGKTATAVKLIRNCFMAPIALILAAVEQRNNNRAIDHANLKRAFPWFLFGYFVMAFMNSRGFFTAAGVAAFSSWGKFLILLGMVGVGLNTVFSAFSKVGMRPLIVGLLGSLIVAACSLTLINILI